MQLYMFKTERFTKEFAKKQYGSSFATIRLQIFDRDPICKDCGRRPSEDVDHIIPVCFGGDHIGVENLQGLCRSCHRDKTRDDVLLYSVAKHLKLAKTYGKSYWWFVSQSEVLTIYKLLWHFHRKQRQFKNENEVNNQND